MQNLKTKCRLAQLQRVIIRSNERYFLCVKQEREKTSIGNLVDANLIIHLFIEPFCWSMI